MPTRKKRTQIFAALASGALILTACGENGVETEPEQPAIETPEVTVPEMDDTDPNAEGTDETTPAEEEATVIEVSGTEFALELDETTLSPGTYTFVLTNDGQAPHALEVEGEGIHEESDQIEPGETTELTVTLEPGTYELYCPVGNHQDQGMTVEITVEE